MWCLLLADDSMPICRTGKLHGIRERVALVQEAFRMMQEAAPEGPGEAAVPFAVCCLLLGDSPAAEAILGFGPSPAGMHVDAAIQDFIKVRPPCSTGHRSGPSWPLGCLQLACMLSPAIHYIVKVRCQ